MKDKVSPARFAKLLNGYMDDESLDVPSLAWVLDCKGPTVRRWLVEGGYPNRDNAIKLSCLSHDLERFFNALAGATEAQARLGKKRAA